VVSGRRALFLYHWTRRGPFPHCVGRLRLHLPHTGPTILPSGLARRRHAVVTNWWPTRILPSPLLPLLAGMVKYGTRTWWHSRRHTTPYTFSRRPSPTTYLAAVTTVATLHLPQDRHAFTTGLPLSTHYAPTAHHTHTHIASTGARSCHVALSPLKHASCTALPPLVGTSTTCLPCLQFDLRTHHFPWRASFSLNHYLPTCPFYYLCHHSAVLCLPTAFVPPASSFTFWVGREFIPQDCLPGHLC